MLDLAKQIIRFYLEMWQKPLKTDLVINDETLLTKRWNVFVTMYKNWDVIWSSGNVVEIETDLVNELIEACVWCIEDKRFSSITIIDFENVKIRIDLIENRAILTNKKLSSVNPLNSWVIVIKKDYTKLWVILPGISANIITWDDFWLVLNKKLNEDFVENNYIIYEIQTQKLTDF